MPELNYFETKIVTDKDRITEINDAFMELQTEAEKTGILVSKEKFVQVVHPDTFEPYIQMVETGEIIGPLFATI